jgi:hypothetical protein
LVTSTGDIKRLVDDLRQVFDALHQKVVLGAGARDAERVGLLKRVAADQLTGDLAGDGHDGDGVHQGVHQAGCEVRGARSRSGAADPRFAGGARVAFGREGGVFFVPHQHVADLVLIERIVKGERDAAGIPEHTVDALAHQAFQKHRGAVHQRRHELCLNPKRYITKKAIWRVRFPRRWPWNLVPWAFKRGR